MGHKKLELDIDDEMLDFLLREGIRANIKSDFSDKKVMVLPPEWVGMIKDRDAETVDSVVDETVPVNLTPQDIAEEDEAIEYFISLGLEAILRDRFNSVEEELAVNNSIDISIGVSVH
jgi:hypothetical protein